MRKVDLNKKYNLPEKVIFCKRCVISNQRPRIEFDEEGVCNACRYFDYKQNINWKERVVKLINLLYLRRSKRRIRLRSSFLGWKRLGLCCPRT